MLPNPQLFIRFVRRLIRAGLMGFVFTGTSRFNVPKCLNWKGKKYDLDMPDEASLAWVFRDLILDDEYGLRCLRTRPLTILDVVAKVGLFSLWSGVCFPSAIIHAYEPNKELQPYLSRNLAQVGATVFAEGVSAADGFADIAAGGKSMLGQCKSNNAGSVPIVSLGTAIARIGGSVDLLKLDCEGAEWPILDAPEAFEHVKDLRMEYHLLHQHQTVECLVERFQRAGFRLVHLSCNKGFGMAWFSKTLEG